MAEMHFRTALFLIALITKSVAVNAEQVSTNRVVCAIVAPICARANLRGNRTIVERLDPATRSREELWSFPAWLNIVGIDETGSVVLVEAARFAEVPKDVTSDFVVLQLYRQGALSREFKLKDLMSTDGDLSTARRLGAWAKRMGSMNSDVARYQMIDGRILKIDLPGEKVVIE